MSTSLYWPSLAAVCIAVMYFNNNKVECVNERTEQVIESIEPVEATQSAWHSNPDMGRGSLYIF